MFTEAQGHVYVTALSYFVPLFIFFIGCLLFLALIFVLSSVHFAVILFLSSALLHAASVSLCLAYNGVVSVRA